MTDTTLVQGTAAWFEMVGRLLVDAASRAALPADLNVSLVERYSDGTGLSDGLVQGLRFELLGGKPVFRAGVGPSERGDVTIEVTAAAARTLNTLYADDPHFAEARGRFLATGEMVVAGDPSRFGAWFDTVHDPIVDRTR